MEEYSSVFRHDLPHGLPPQRSVDHAVEVYPEATSPHRTIFKLSHVKLLATKDYVSGLIRNEKIRPSKSPYGASLFFVKQKGKLRGVIDYRALNRMMKPDDAPTPCTDEMFDGVGQTSYFLRLDLKSGFHQIQVSPDDV